MSVEEFVRTANNTLDPAELEKLLSTGRSLLEKVDGAEKGKVCGTLGNIFFALQRFDDAEKAYIDALQIYLKLAEEDESMMRYVAGCLFNLGNLYQVRRKYEEAEKAYTDALKVLEYLRDDAQVCAVMYALGTMYAKLGLYKESEKKLLEAFELAHKLKDIRQMLAILNNLAVVYTNMNRKKEAEILLRKALEVVTESGSKAEILTILQNLLPFLDEIEFDEVLKKLEDLGDLPPDVSAKVKYFKAKKLEKLGSKDVAAKLYFDAACWAFIAYRMFGMQSVNFIYCLEKTAELSDEIRRDAETLKFLILRYYFSANVEVDVNSRVGRMLETYINSGEIDGDEPLAQVIRVIGEDLKTSGIRNISFNKS